MAKVRTGKYRPSNGSEGMVFMEQFCDNCKLNENEDCEILTNSMIFEVSEEEYPKELTFDKRGNPTCTAFRRIS